MFFFYYCFMLKKKIISTLKLFHYHKMYIHLKLCKNRELQIMLEKCKIKVLFYSCVIYDLHFSLQNHCRRPQYSKGSSANVIFYLYFFMIFDDYNTISIIFLKYDKVKSNFKNQNHTHTIIRSQTLLITQIQPLCSQRKML